MRKILIYSIFKCVSIIRMNLQIKPHHSENEACFLRNQSSCIHLPLYRRLASARQFRLLRGGQTQFNHDGHTSHTAGVDRKSERSTLPALIHISRARSWVGQSKRRSEQSGCLHSARPRILVTSPALSYLLRFCVLQNVSRALGLPRLLVLRVTCARAFSYLFLKYWNTIFFTRASRLPSRGIWKSSLCLCLWMYRELVDQDLFSILSFSLFFFFYLTDGHFRGI